MVKERVDILAYRQGLFDTREQAKRGVMAGLVVSAHDGQRFDKPGEKIEDSIELRLKGEKLKYVSRGGLKLEKALQVFALSVAGLTTLDIGASTGGFTDVMLQAGAARVYALDVGTNQLAWKLRQDPRVISMEQFNFRQASLEDFQEGQPQFASIDVSFISLALIFPVLSQILADKGRVVALVKPQFEAGRDSVGKKGIVRDKKVHEQVVEKVLTYALEAGFSIHDLTFSPIQGGQGNIEYLLHLEKAKEPIKHYQGSIKDLINQSHKEFLDVE